MVGGGPSSTSSYSAPFGGGNAPSAPSPAGLRPLAIANFPPAPASATSGYSKVDSHSKPTSPSYASSPSSGGAYNNPVPLATRQLPIVSGSFHLGEKRGRDEGNPPPPTVAPPTGAAYRPQVPPPSVAGSNSYSKLPQPPTPVGLSRENTASYNPPPPPVAPPQSYSDQRTQMLLQRYAAEDTEARKSLYSRLSVVGRPLPASLSSSLTSLATPRRFGTAAANRFSSPVAVTARLPPPPVPSTTGKVTQTTSPHGRLQPLPPVAPLRAVRAFSSLGLSGENNAGHVDEVSRADLARLANVPDQTRAMLPSVIALQLASTTTAIKAFEKYGITISEADRKFLKNERVRIRAACGNSANALVQMDISHRLIMLNRKFLETRAATPPPPPTSAPYSSGSASLPATVPLPKIGGKLFPLSTVKGKKTAATAVPTAKAARKAVANVFLLDGSFAAQRKQKAAQKVHEMRHHIHYQYKLPAEASRLDPKPEVMVIDTCAIMNMTQNQLQELTLRLGKIELAIPYLVINELDGINKNRLNPEKQVKAKLSREWLLQMQEAQLVRVQRREEVDASVEATADNNDDRILAFAVYVQKEEAANGRRPIRLLTDDRTFRVKAQAERLVVCDTSELLSEDYH